MSKEYRGSELTWSTDDVSQIASEMGYKLSDEDMKRVLNATFEDNEYLMQLINEQIQDTITYMIESGSFKSVEQ